jgi:hypothetical protein
MIHYMASPRLFFLPCLVIFILNCVSVSFDISIKKNGFWNKTDPPYGNVWIRLWDTCTLVHCRALWSVVNLWRRYNDLGWTSWRPDTYSRKQKIYTIYNRDRCTVFTNWRQTTMHDNVLMYMYLRGGSRHFHKGDPFFLC